ncbi:hypothetical protein [Clostridium felsineum]|uniref:hypothetical protein n=1 Tax=Clostridium felsineum TaxID=36839 RepID=UPI00098C4303|nr:hypothetical protein [Clostridium felsineum]URZ18573.1 hypothetical protein CLFE_046610 [Clostridium felsineum DSM 794]
MDWKEEYALKKRTVKFDFLEIEKYIKEEIDDINKLIKSYINKEGTFYYSARSIKSDDQTIDIKYKEDSYISFEQSEKQFCIYLDGYKYATSRSINNVKQTGNDYYYINRQLIDNIFKYFLYDEK